MFPYVQKKKKKIINKIVYICVCIRVCMKEADFLFKGVSLHFNPIQACNLKI